MGTHPLVATYPDVANPLISTSTATGSIVVTPAPLTMTASSAIVNFGDPVPTITATYSGFVNGDSAASLTTQPTCTTTYTQGSPVSGSPYQTSCTGAADPNYTITPVNGTVTVNGAPLTITASSASVPYGSAIPTITPSFTGFLAGDTASVLTAQPVCTTTAVLGSPVGTYPTTCSGATAANYTISYVGGTITITAVPLTITASSTAVNYGSPVPAITPAFVGFVNGESSANLTTQPTCSTTYAQGSGVSGSPYPTSCSGAADPNYTISYVPGTVTVSAVGLTITASSTTLSYGAAAPVIAPSFAGFVNGDTAASLTTQPACSTTYKQGSPVSGSPYPSTCSGTVDPNYTISYVPGTVTVNAVTLTITASSTTLTYGAAAPIITPSFAGFVNGDSSASLTTQPTCTTTYAQGSPIAGSPYPSTCSGAVDTNYTIGYVPGTVTVGAAPLTITASSTSMTYGGAVPAITPSFAGFVNGQNSSALTTQPTCSTTATVTSTPGTYPTSCTGAVAANYAISYLAGTVTVGKANSLTTITGHTPSPSNVGQAVIVTASVAPQFSGTPTGSITINATTGESCAGAISAGVASCSITFTTPGTRTLTAAYGGDSNFAGSLSAGVAQNVVAVGLSVSPASLPFADTLLNTNSATMSVTLTNTGARLTTLTYSFTDPNYTKLTGTNACGTTLNTNASCIIYVRFRPTSLGAHPATLNINAGTTLASVTLSGNGVAPIAALGALTPSPLVATRGSTAQGTVTLSNTGTGPMTITSVSLGGTNATQFRQTNNCGTSLAAGANFTITVTFAPPAGTTRGNKTATLRVRDNSTGVANSLQTTALNGTAQ